MKAHITGHIRDKNNRRIDDFDVIMVNKTKVSKCIDLRMKAHITGHIRDKNNRRIDDFDVIMVNKTKVSRGAKEDLIGIRSDRK